MSENKLKKKEKRRIKKILNNIEPIMQFLNDFDISSYIYVSEDSKESSIYIQAEIDITKKNNNYIKSIKDKILEKIEENELTLDIINNDKFKIIMIYNE